MDRRRWKVQKHGQLIDLETTLSTRTLLFPVPPVLSDFRPPRSFTELSERLVPDRLAMATTDDVGYLEPLEKIFQQVEEESERRAQEEVETQKLTQEALQQVDTDATIKQVKRRRRGSVSISRIGQLVEESLPSPNRLTKISSNSPFYQAQIDNASDNSIASGASAFSDDNAHAEDQTHVTQMHRIAGKDSLTKMIPRKLSRARSEVIPNTADGGVVIGVLVQEATVHSILTDEDEQEPNTTSRVSVHAPGSIRHQTSRMTISGPTPVTSTWVERAKGFTQKFRRKKATSAPPARLAT